MDPTTKMIIEVTHVMNRTMYERENDDYDDGMQ
jgi:hypothetical protein